MQYQAICHATQYTHLRPADNLHGSVCFFRTTRPYAIYGSHRPIADIYVLACRLPYPFLNRDVSLPLQKRILLASKLTEDDGLTRLSLRDNSHGEL